MNREKMRIIARVQTCEKRDRIVISMIMSVDQNTWAMYTKLSIESWPIVLWFQLNYLIFMSSVAQFFIAIDAVVYFPFPHTHSDHNCGVLREGNIVVSL